MPVEIKIVRFPDEILPVAPGVFDDPLDAGATREFLSDPRHHIAVAVDAGVIVGFASGVHYVHPDKPVPELWINEVGVAAGRQGEGIGKLVVGALLEKARQLGCSEAWVLTDKTNTAAMRLYTSLGGSEEREQLMFKFPFVGDSPTLAVDWRKS